MEENKDSEKSIVQFNVVNTTSNTISVDLFDLSTLNSTPTQLNYINAPNTVVSTLSTALTNFLVINNGSCFKINSIIGLTQVTIFDTNNIISFSGTIFVQTNSITYNPLNNSVYLIQNSAQVIREFSCNSNTIIGSFPYSNITDVYGANSFYNLTNNSIYLINTNTNNIDVFSCSSNTFTASVLSPNPLVSATNFIYNGNQNLLYLGDPSFSPTSDIFDCNTNTFTSTLPINTFQAVFNSNNNNLYIPNFLTVNIFSVLSNTFVGSITLNQISDNLGGIDLNSNFLYLVGSNQYISVVDCTTNTLLTEINTIATLNFRPTYNPVTSLMLIGNFVFPQTGIFFITPLGITTTPYYVTGAVNYNYFVQNLQNEPIIVSKVRVISPQTQLDNVANILTIDSSGIQSQYPVIPLLTVSAWQDQANISELKFKELVLDGRTFISNYLINPNTSVILEIHYEQLDNTKIRYLGKMLPKKVPLKGFFDDYVDLSM
jgi:hypothetical protein